MWYLQSYVQYSASSCSFITSNSINFNVSKHFIELIRMFRIFAADSLPHRQPMYSGSIDSHSVGNPRSSFYFLFQCSFLNNCNLCMIFCVGYSVLHITLHRNLGLICSQATSAVGSIAYPFSSRQAKWDSFCRYLLSR